MKKLLSIAVLCLTALFIVSLFSCKPQAPKANLKTEIDSLSYAYGVQITQGLDQYLLQRGVEETEKADFLKGFHEGVKVKKGDKKTWAQMVGKEIGKQVAVDMLSNINQSIFGSDSTNSLTKSQLLAGFFAAFEDKPLILKKEETEMYIQMKSTEIQSRGNEKLKAEGEAFLAENKNKPGVIELESGLQYKVEQEGDGPKPTAEDKVKVNYKGTLINGTEFDSNEGSIFPLDNVIRGWTEGIQLMSVGSKYTLYVPYDLGYGERGYPPNIGPYATLIFEVDLLDIVKE